MVLDPKAAAAAAGGSSDPAKKGGSEEGAGSALTKEDVDKQISEGIASGIKDMMPGVMKEINDAVTGSTKRQLGDFTKSVPELISVSVAEAIKTANAKPAPEPTDFQNLEQTVTVLQTSLKDSIARGDASEAKAVESDRKTAINLMLGEAKIKGDLTAAFNALVVNGHVTGIEGKPEIVDDQLVYVRDSGNEPAEKVLADFLSIKTNSDTWVDIYKVKGSGAGGSSQGAGGGGAGEFNASNFDASNAGDAAANKAMQENPERTISEMDKSNAAKTNKLGIGVWD